jgi:hypothetical protein
MKNESRGRAAWMLAIVALTIAGAQRAAAQGLEPIAYGISIPAPGTQCSAINAR